MLLLMQFMQFYMVYLLVDLIHTHPDTYSWHAAATAAFFGVMFLGNICTTSFAIYSKYRYGKITHGRVNLKLCHLLDSENVLHVYLLSLQRNMDSELYLINSTALIENYSIL